MHPHQVPCLILVETGNSQMTLGEEFFTWRFLSTRHRPPLQRHEALPSHRRCRGTCVLHLRHPDPVETALAAMAVSLQQQILRY